MTQEKYRFWTIVIAAAAAIGAVLPIVAGYFQYASNVEKTYKAPFWTSQMETCSAVTKTSADIAMSANNGTVPEKLIDQLFSIFYGTGQLYLDNETLEAVGTVGSRAVQCNAGNLKDKKCIQPLFNAFSMNVAQACRDMLTVSWGVPLEELNSELLKPDFSQAR